MKLKKNIFLYNNDTCLYFNNWIFMTAQEENTTQEILDNDLQELQDEINELE